MIKSKIVIATGGTGGHVFPAYSLMNILKKEYNLLLTTDKRGFNYLKNYQNINLIRIPSSPFIRKNILRFSFSIMIIFFSIIRSFILLLFFRPKIIIGTGGYSSFPICVAAIFLRIKFVIYENNLVIGKANKYLLPFAKKIFVSFEEVEGISRKYIDKIVKIGNIVRSEIIDSNINVKKKVDDFDELRVLVLGGSQAAKIFADELPPIFEKIKNRKLNISVYQQCHKNQNEKLAQFYKKAKIDYKIFNFTDKIIDYYSKANLVITRSGASVLGELINIKIPFIAIPLPSSADNHQYKNAEFYQNRGYGFLLNEKDINSKLYDLICSMFDNKLLLTNILSNQRQYSDKNIFKNLKTQLEEIIDEKH